ncbi:flagellar hook capping FlgD N-terminal domain-containing protein [Acutalibacter sp. 1XD8-36]|uniref:flagellar hook capping FlgD N-terminal domain-containing protein n=1 Tax=Acutalibacter sp. 1XD8-36 TaxID=2320852 RepID=UPI00260FCB39|nr:flagellar hook capping FlgD N-terminal domain-containing protein [Acutalibacter sp. 1XD8-36]
MANAGMNDLANILGTAPPVKNATQSTNNKAGSSLDMTDFLTLMVAMFQNQDIDNAASTTDMMNQFVQMSVVQAITNISTLIDDSTVLTYAASLVGKEVTIGEVVNKEMVETVGTVIGTGTLNGQQVIFLDNDKSYYLNQILAVGRLPEIKDDVVPDEGEGEGEDDKVEGGENTGGTDKPEAPDPDTDPGDKPEGGESTTP